MHPRLKEDLYEGYRIPMGSYVGVSFMNHNSCLYLLARYLRYL